MVKSIQPVRRRPGGFLAFSHFVRRFIVAAAVPALGLAGVWSHILPSYRIQRDEITGVIVVLAAFEVAYVYSLRTLIARTLGRRVLLGGMPRGISALVLWAPAPILLLLSFVQFYSYTNWFDDSTMVETAKAVAWQEQEVSSQAAEYATMVASQVSPGELVRLSREYLPSHSSRTPTVNEIREGALGPVAFSWQLITSAALSVTLAMFAFVWIATIDCLVETQSARDIAR